jgi:hypothetical protein
MQERREHTVAAADFLVVGNFLRHISRFHRTGRTKHDEKLRSIQRTENRRCKIRIGRQLILVAEDGENPLRNHIATAIGGAHQIGGHFVGLDLLVQPGRPLPTGLGIVGVAVADEAPEGAGQLHGRIWEIAYLTNFNDVSRCYRSIPRAR